MRRMRLVDDWTWLHVPVTGRERGVLLRDGGTLINSLRAATPAELDLDEHEGASELRVFGS